MCPLAHYLDIILHLETQRGIDYLNEQKTLPYNAAMQSLANLPSTVFQPSGVEQTLYQTN
jgi:hypothetical protein